MNEKQENESAAAWIAEVPSLNAEMRAILWALSRGNTRRTSIAYAGIHHDTFYEWLRKNTLFAEAIVRAEASAEVAHVEVLVQAALKGDWRASLEWLKRRRRAEWGDKLDLSKLDDATLLRLLERSEGGDTEGVDPAGVDQAA